MCYHTYPLYLKELRESPNSNDLQPLRFIHVPACIIVGIIGLVVEIPLYTAIALVKSPYMLFKGWQRLTHDLISREGPFACIPIAGLAILLWPFIVLVCVVLSIFTSFFIGLYGSVIVNQERSFRRGVAYVIAMVAEFDEYTNDWLYLREGSILPRPRYRKKQISHSSEFSVKGTRATEEKIISLVTEAPAMVIPSISSSRSVKEALQEVKMVQDLTIHSHANKKEFELDIDRILRGDDSRTTLMLKNIPNKYSSKLLLATIDEHCKGIYDFVYLPIDFKNNCNVGYAFINVIDPLQIVRFISCVLLVQSFNGEKWEKFNSEKVYALAYARIQGKAALIDHFQNSSLMNEDKGCRPIIFCTDGPNAGKQEPFPLGAHIRVKGGKTRGSVYEENRHCPGSPSTSPNTSESDQGSISPKSVIG